VVDVFGVVSKNHIYKKMKKSELKQLIIQIISEQSNKKKCCEDSQGNITTASSYPTGKCPKSQTPVVCEGPRPGRGQPQPQAQQESLLLEKPTCQETARAGFDNCDNLDGTTNAAGDSFDYDGCVQAVFAAYTACKKDSGGMVGVFPTDNTKQTRGGSVPTGNLPIGTRYSRNNNGVDPSHPDWRDR